MLHYKASKRCFGVDGVKKKKEENESSNAKTHAGRLNPNNRIDFLPFFINILGLGVGRGYHFFRRRRIAVERKRPGQKTKTKNKQNEQTNKQKILLSMANSTEFVDVFLSVFEGRAAGVS